MNNSASEQRKLEASIRHVAFEAYHLRLCSHLCKNALREKWRLEAAAQSVSGQYPRSFYDSAFEYAFYIHLRVLLYFFYVKPLKGMDDVTLSYFVEPATVTLQPMTEDELVKIRADLSKRLAHLTESRRETQPVAADIGDGLKYYLDYGDKVILNLLEFEKALCPSLLRVYQDRMDNEFRPRDLNLRRFLTTPTHFGIASDFDITQPGEPLALPPNHPHARVMTDFEVR